MWVASSSLLKLFSAALNQNIGTVGGCLQHISQTSHLPLYAAEAVGQLLLLLWRAVFCLVTAAFVHGKYLPGVFYDGDTIYP